VRRLLVARLGQSLIVVILVATISFFVIRLAPGDPFSFVGENIPFAVRDHWRRVYGFDRPPLEQFGRYVLAVFHGDFGWSFLRKDDVSSVIADALPRTILLVGLALLLSFAIGMAAGVLQATRRGTWFDRVSSGVLVFFYSLPDFWAALMILFLFAHRWRLFPTAGIVHPVLYDYWPPWRQFIDRVQHLVLPLFAFTLVTVAAVARYQRAAMLEILPSDYVRTARAKGVPERGVVWHHALRTALTPMVALLGLMLPAYLGGAVFIEKVFDWPGLGSLAADSIQKRDYFLVTATVIVGSIMVVVGNLVADLLQMALDPRVRE
jgi:peptide/nickel transport system permease protein